MENLTLIRTTHQLNSLIAYLKDKEYIAFDTETTGLSLESRIIGFSVAAEDNQAFYVILSYWDVEQQKMVDLETMKNAHLALKALCGKNLIMHNAVFDCSMVQNNFKIDLMSSLHTDTMILGHLLDEKRSNGLKELGVSIFGEDASKEQTEMKKSVYERGGALTKEKYELYKADPELLGKYGAKDALLTLNLFYYFVDQLFKEGLNGFFYEDESMPLLKGPTYELNTSGLRVDPDKLMRLKNTLEAECMEAKAFIYKEIAAHTKDKYPGTRPGNTFNISASKQLAWLLFFELDNEFNLLTEQGKELCKFFDLKLPYSNAAKHEFIRLCRENKDRVWEPAAINPKTGKLGRPKKVGDPWSYTACGRESLTRYANKYAWVKTLLEFKKNEKLLNTYVSGIQDRMQYNIIRPSFLQHGTTSGRYSSRNPNFQNLPRNDKRVKSCIIARPGKVFVGADYSQLEPRVFASFSKDQRLLDCFKNGDDFYSVIGAEVFEKYDCSLKKNDTNSFARLYSELRDISKVIALSTTYGTTAPKLSRALNRPIKECQMVIDSYFERFPAVRDLMLESHEIAKREGKVVNLFGRPRRIPLAKYIGDTPFEDLDYEFRNLLNLAINHRIQSTGASIMNRAAIAFYSKCRAMEKEDKRWSDVKVVLQVHDQLVAECPKEIADIVALILKDAMENTVTLPGVALVAEPFISEDLAGQK